jgi:hypothetical protein
MIIISDTCSINIIISVDDTSKILIEDSRVMLLIVASLTDNSIGIICDHNMFIVQATGGSYFFWV